MVICVDSFESNPSAISEIEVIDLSSRPSRSSPSSPAINHPYKKHHHYPQQRGRGRQSEIIYKGKKPASIKIIEIDSDSDRQPDASDLDPLKTQAKTPSSTVNNNNKQKKTNAHHPPPPREFPLQRIPSAARNPHYLQELTRQFFASTHRQLGAHRWNAHVRVVPMNRQEEQSLFDFVSGYPRGDIRLSSILYRNYQRQAPEFSAENYRIYYRAHQSRLEAQQQQQPPPECYTSTNRTTNASEKQAQHITEEEGEDDDQLDDEDDEDDEEEEERQQTTENTTPESVASTDYSIDEIGMDQLLLSAGPDRAKIAKTFNIPLDKWELILALQHDPFPAWSTTNPAELGGIL